MRFQAIGISRHRLGSDGAGVTTLVGGHGCPLDCKYCLNPQCKWGSALQSFDLEELYERFCVDSLYFEATGGGVTFGGGEPLLQAEFIRAFIKFCRKKGKTWRFALETCLAVEETALSAVEGLVDEYIVDVKDMNDEIYRAYTGKSSDKLKRNLLRLAVSPETVTLKLPLIPEYNTASDVLASETALRELGYRNFIRFRYITEIKKQRILSK